MSILINICISCQDEAKEEIQVQQERKKISRGTALNKHLIFFLISCLFEALTLVLTQLDKSAPLKQSQFPPAVLDVWGYVFVFSELHCLSLELAHEQL